MNHLKKTDLQIYNLIKAEEKRQKDVLEMIPSENYTSQAVIEALGTVLTNKYSEGFPKKRYYQGNEVIDQVEMLAQVLLPTLQSILPSSKTARSSWGYRFLTVDT